MSYVFDREINNIDPEIHAMGPNNNIWVRGPENHNFAINIPRLAINQPIPDGVQRYYVLDDQDDRVADFLSETERQRILAQQEAEKKAEEQRKRDEDQRKRDEEQRIKTEEQWEKEAPLREEERRRAEEEAREDEARRIEQWRRNFLFPNPSNDGYCMPEWYNRLAQEYSAEIHNRVGRQEGIRATYTYGRYEWIQYFVDSSFPSSYIAGYTIVKNLLNNPVVATKYRNLESIALADIGCGNGGASLGAITAIEETLPNINEISLDAYDYSNTALDLFRTCLNQYCYYSRITFSRNFRVVQFVPQGTRIRGQYTLDNFGRFCIGGNNREYDFILCFKMINELIAHMNNQGFNNNTIYSEMCRITTRHLSDKGFFILLDVSLSSETDPNGRIIDNFEYGKALNQQLRSFVRNNQNFKAIIPIPCALIEGGCNDNRWCFQQKLFAPNGESPTGYPYRRFPATYKVISRSTFADEILSNLKNRTPSDYFICTRMDKNISYCRNDGNNRFLREDQVGDGQLDGFNL